MKNFLKKFTIFVLKILFSLVISLLYVLDFFISVFKRSPKAFKKGLNKIFRAIKHALMLDFNDSINQKIKIDKQKIDYFL